MIALAPYPDGISVWSIWNGSSMPGGNGEYYEEVEFVPPSVYNKVVGHYNNVSDWCKENLTGPYELDERTDILFDGVRIRIGRESDMAYFQLRWG